MATRPSKLKLTNGQQCEFDVVVAADGQWSALRKKCFNPETIRVVDKNMYAAYFTVPRASSDTDYWRVFWPLRRRIVTARPDPYGSIRVALTIMPRNENQKQAWESASRSDRAHQISLLKSEFSEVQGDVPRYLKGLDKSTDFYLQGVKQIKMSKWWTSRIICLGDAAYAPTPLTGMETPLAIIGAYVLAGELSMLKEGENPARAFEEYEKTFRPFVEKTQYIPITAPGVFHPTYVWQRWLLQFVLSIVAKGLAMPFLAKLFGRGEGPEAEDGGFPMPLYPTLEE